MFDPLSLLLERAARRVLEIAPTYSGAHYWVGLVLLIEGKVDGALAEMQAEGDDEARLDGLALTYHALHRTKEADAALARMVAMSSPVTLFSCVVLACVLVLFTPMAVALALAILTSLGGLVADWPAQRPPPKELADLEKLL